MAVCPSCGQENPDGFRFCGACAAPLGDATVAREERKVVTALFCDLVGSTAQGELLDPEDVQALLSRYHSQVRVELERFGGTVEKFIGDAVVALFGAPVAHEDDPERAVRAALAVKEWVLQQSDLHVRIAVNTGEALVVVGARASHGEHMASGDVLNTAARLQTAAPVDGILVGEQTFRATERVIRYRELAPIEVKGKADPVAVWEVLEARSRFGVDVERAPRTRLVGRELEQPLLIGTLRRAVQQRTVQLVTVVGEPGVGKSRLIAELLLHVEAEPELVRWRQGRCLPYGEGITFWALGEIVKAEAGILESDSADAALRKLDGAVSPGEPERQWLLQRLAPLVGVEASSPAERQELFTAWRRFLEGLAADCPTVLVFDDVHWADEALLAFLEYLAEWSEGVPLLIVCAARPELYERRPGWGAGLRNVHVINLSPLSDREMAELVSQLLSTGPVGEEAQRSIVERVGGNPLYAEEFVRLLAEWTLGADELLPDTVQALIAARLDTLSADRKGLLQDAAVLGKVFWAGALAEMGGRTSADVEVVLHELARKELVRPSRTSSMEDEREYSFWHLLVRDVAYSQIPRIERARRHEAVAAWIQRKAGARVEDLAEVLAHHYLQALDLAKAAGDTARVTELAAPARRFLALAGERALGLDTAQAEARLARALELTQPDEMEWPELLTRWADALFQGGRPREAAEALDEALASMRDRGQREAAAQALQLRSRLAVRLGEGRDVEFAVEAVELLEQGRPGPALVEAYAQLANGQSLAGAFAEAIAVADRAQALAESLDLPESARALSCRGLARAYLGDPDGLAEAHRAHTLFVDAGAGRAAAIVLNNLALAEYPLIGPERALATFEEGIAFCEPRGLVEAAAQLECNCPGLLVELGRPLEAAARAARLAPALESSGDTPDLIEIRAAELLIRTARGEQGPRPEVDWIVSSAQKMARSDISIFALTAAAAALVEAAPERSHDLIAELERVPGARQDPYYARQLPTALRTALAVGDRALAKQLVDGLHAHYPLDEHTLVSARSELAEHAGEHAEAASLYGETAARWRQFGNVPERAYALLGEGRCLLALDRPEAQRPLRQARDLFASMGYKPALAEAESLLQRMAAASA
jgi:class 3 adenylate cyclase